MLENVLAKSLLLSLVLGFAVGCGKDDDANQGHGEPAAACAAIGDVCTHEVVSALGQECHDISHDNDAAVCAAREDECVSHCEAETAAGGAGGEGGEGGAPH